MPRCAIDVRSVSQSWCARLRPACSTGDLCIALVWERQGIESAALWGQVAQGLGLLIGTCVGVPKTAQTIASIVVLTFVLTGGYFVRGVCPACAGHMGCFSIAASLCCLQWVLRTCTYSRVALGYALHSALQQVKAEVTAAPRRHPCVDLLDPVHQLCLLRLQPAGALRVQGPRHLQLRGPRAAGQPRRSLCPGRFFACYAALSWVCVSVRPQGPGLLAAAHAASQCRA